MLKVGCISWIECTLTAYQDTSHSERISLQKQLEMVQERSGWAPLLAARLRTASKEVEENIYDIYNKFTVHVFENATGSGPSSDDVIPLYGISHACDGRERDNPRINKDELSKVYCTDKTIQHCDYCIENTKWQRNRVNRPAGYRRRNGIVLPSWKREWYKT